MQLLCACCGVVYKPKNPHVKGGLDCTKCEATVAAQSVAMDAALENAEATGVNAYEEVRRAVRRQVERGEP